MKKIAETRYKNLVIQVFHGNITDLTVDAIVNPSNKYLKMDSGIALAIKKAAGKVVEDEAFNILKNYKNQSHLKDYGGFCPIGEAVITTAGNLKPNIKFIIHTPIMNDLIEESNRNRLLSAIRATMQRAYELWWNLGLDKDSVEVKSIAFPAMGIESGGITKKKSAKAIIDGIINQSNTYFVNAPLNNIILCDIDLEMVEEFKNGLKYFEED
ncbi:MAG: hypothetical protein EAX96_09860 [Candidatus Lokiarchaeota archaeon]|nr:hypothetical protein [Candidatus Lokiarchaeota archaeon]